MSYMSGIKVTHLNLKLVLHRPLLSQDEVEFFHRAVVVKRGCENKAFATSKELLAFGMCNSVIT